MYECKYKLFGAPQGSILDPLLFQMYINDLPHVCSPLEVQLLADDKTHTSSNCKVSDVQGDLLKINNWLKANKLSYYVKKTKINIGNRPSNYSFKIKDFDVHIKPVLKYLRILIDQELSHKKMSILLS